MTNANEMAFTAFDLTKREYFAAMAMQGLLANEYANDKERNREAEKWVETISYSAVKYADALIKELNEQK